MLMDRAEPVPARGARRGGRVTHRFGIVARPVSRRPFLGHEHKGRTGDDTGIR